MHRYYCAVYLHCTSVSFNSTKIIVYNLQYYNELAKTIYNTLSVILVLSFLNVPRYV